MLVCAVGFLIYWTLSLRGRILQFGILRALGVSQRQLLYMIVLEQLFLSGAAIVMGILIGGAACALFVPALELFFTAANQAPPFKVIALRSDYLKIYAIVLVMLAAGLAFLRWFIRRLKIGSALKLGEE
jgi:putative ABC transport system permease protein